MESIIYTLSAILLYLLSDRVLQGLEVYFGRRFEHRTVVFFVILLGSAVITFALLRRVFAPGQA